MKIKRQIVVFDAPDLEAESAFWAELLEGTVNREDDWHMVCVDGEPRIGVQLAPDHARPDWPHGAAQQIHLDLYVESIAPAHERAIECGATVLSDESPADEASGFWVYADPAGHPFCLCW